MVLSSYNYLVGVSKDKVFRAYFNTLSQTYSVYKEGILLIDNKYRFIDIKSYIN